MNARRNSVASKLVFVAVFAGAVLGAQAGIALADTHWGEQSPASVTRADDTHWNATNSISLADGPSDTHWGVNSVSPTTADDPADTHWGTTDPAPTAPADTHWGIADTVVLADGMDDTHWGVTDPAPADTHW